MKKTRIVLLYGGVSPEHEVSVKSAAFIAKYIDITKYTVYPVYIAKDGSWNLARDKNIGSQGLEYNQFTKVVLSPLFGESALICLDDENTKIEFDILWPVLHGKNGEDGTIQGMCRMMGIKYVGSDSYSSAVCMDKELTKTVIDKTDIEQASYMAIREERYLANTEEYHKNIMSIMYDDAVFIKPARSGSSVGISRVDEIVDLKEAIKKAFEEDTKIIVEEEIKGRELEVAILGNDEPIASCVGEILPEAVWYDYDSKYKSEISKTVVPAPITKAQSDYIQKTAIEVYKILGCSSLARIDFFLADDDRIIFNEVNTLPGFTENSMFPKLWGTSGVGYKELIDKIIELTCEKWT